MHDALENIQFSSAFYPVVSTDATVINGTGVSMANYNLFTAVVQHGVDMAGGVTIEVKESTDDTTYTAFSTAKQATIASDTEGGVAEVHVRAEEMGDTDLYLRVEVTPDTGTAAPIGGLNVRNAARYPQATLAS
jgi:uncharacterized protein YunC (DUF1805 family)